MSICLRYTSSEEDALEVLNDAFFKVFTKIKQYDPESSLKTWIRSILINTAIDHYRKTAKHIYVELEEVDNNCSDSSVEQLDYKDILSMINELPEVQRMVFNLYEIEGYKHSEIADLMGIKTSTSRVNLTKAKKKLRELFHSKHKVGYGKAI